MDLAESITAKVVALAVIVLVICSVALPVISDAQTSQYSIENNTNIAYKAVFAEDTEVHTLSTSVNADSSYNIVVDGEIAVANLTYAIGVSDAIRGDTVVIVMAANGGMSLYVADLSNIPVSAGNSIIFNQGTIQTDISGTVTDRGTYGFVYLPDAAGDLGTVGNLNSDIFVSNESDILCYVSGSSLGFENAGNALIEYSLKDGFKSLVIALDDNGTITVEKYTTGYEVTPNNFVQIDDVHYSYRGGLSVKDLDSNQTVTANTAYFPIEYKYLSDENTTYNALFGLVSIMLILVPVMFAVRMLGAGRN